MKTIYYTCEKCEDIQCSCMAHGPDYDDAPYGCPYGCHKTEWRAAAILGEDDEPEPPKEKPRTFRTDGTREMLETCGPTLTVTEDEA